MFSFAVCTALVSQCGCASAAPAAKAPEKPVASVHVVVVNAPACQPVVACTAGKPVAAGPCCRSGKGKVRLFGGLKGCCK
jgi:hypothetical protein